MTTLSCPRCGSALSQDRALGLCPRCLFEAAGAEASQPEVVVIDLDGEPDAQFTDSTWHAAPRVLIGTHRPAVAHQRERFIEKPFQYPELVRVIQELLDGQDAA